MTSEEDKKTIAALRKQLVQARCQAEEASQARVEFLAKMSHEIRTPLNGLYGMVQLLENTEIDSQQQRYIRLARKSAEDLRALVDDILNFSQAVTGSLKLEKKPFSLTETLDRLLATLSQTIEEKEHTVTTKIDHNLPETLIGDPLRLNQIFTNLLTNAVKYTDPGGKIKVSVNVRQKTKIHTRLEVSVSDNGRGMSKEEVEKAFDPFIQIHPSDNYVNTGTGLGLAITLKLIELMDGKIWVESKKDVGSTFYFSVKLLNQREGKDDSDEETPEQLFRRADKDALPIMLVEDNRVNRELVHIALKEAGYEVHLATNGQEAIDLYKQQTFGLILMDINMPVVDGMTATLAIRTLEHAEQLRKTPVVAITAYAMEGDKERFLSAGMNDYLSKPINMTKLFEAIKRNILKP